jgi:hypothetical protein
MKKITILSLVILLGFTSCKKYSDVPETSGGYDTPVYIDTLTIHGVKHEFLRHRWDAGRVICHSPECWCLKKESYKE